MKAFRRSESHGNSMDEKKEALWEKGLGLDR